MADVIAEKTDDKVVDLDADEKVEEKEEVELDEFDNPVDDSEEKKASEDAEEKTDKDDESAEKKDDIADDKEKEIDPVEALKTEVNSLRQMTRSLRRHTKDLEGKLEKQNEALVDKDIVAVDELSDEDASVVASRNETLEQMVELMSLNPKFEDVNEVCSQSNTDDVVEMLAKSYVAENGGDVDAAVDSISAGIWAKPNPYKQIYELVKTYHPDYVVVEKAADKKDEGKPPKKKEDVAPSLSNIPAGGKGGVGWTSDRIDKLSEVELAKVPADVYEKYMQGELD